MENTTLSLNYIQQVNASMLALITHKIQELDIIANTCEQSSQHAKNDMIDLSLIINDLELKIDIMNNYDNINNLENKIREQKKTVEWDKQYNTRTIYNDSLKQLDNLRIEYIKLNSKRENNMIEYATIKEKCTTLKTKKTNIAKYHGNVKETHEYVNSEIKKLTELNNKLMTFIDANITNTINNNYIKDFVSYDIFTKNQNIDD